MNGVVNVMPRHCANSIEVFVLPGAKSLVAVRVFSLTKYRCVGLTAFGRESPFSPRDLLCSRSVTQSSTSTFLMTAVIEMRQRESSPRDSNCILTRALKAPLSSTWEGCEVELRGCKDQRDGSLCTLRLEVT